MATKTTYREAMWSINMIGGLFGENLYPTVIRRDNQSCIKFFKNPVFHDNLKHIEMKYHFIRYMVHKGIVKPQYIATDE